MTIPVGQFNMSQVNIELGQPATQTISAGNAAVRALAGVPSGQYTANALRGKSAAPPTPTPGPGPAPVPVPTVLQFQVNAGQAYGNFVTENSQQEYRGYAPFLGIGAINTTAFALGTNIQALYCETGGFNQYIELWTTGSHSQMVFAYMNISGSMFYPQDATFSIRGDGSHWIWPATYNFAVGTPTLIDFQI